MSRPAGPRPYSGNAGQVTNNADLNIRPFRTVPQPAESVDPVLSAREVRVLLGGVSHSSLWRWQQDGTLPVCMRIGKSRVGWRRSVIVAWLDARQASAPTAKAA